MTIPKNVQIYQMFKAVARGIGTVRDLKANVIRFLRTGVAATGGAGTDGDDILEVEMDDEDDA